ncbi:POK9 protein, partial [Malurus elegans]|nr:POK9 protein [Malurus elegans]
RSLPSAAGKRQEQRVEPPQQQPRRDTNSCYDPSGTLQPASSLQPATRASIGLDLAASIDSTLLTSQPQKIPTAIRGPITINGQPVGALLLGRSSASMLGLFVLPGVIDADYTGEILVMVYTPFPPVKIWKGQRIAQAVPLEQLTKSIAPIKDTPRGEGGFGSTGSLTLLTINLNEQPKRKIKLCYQGKQHVLTGLLDTGADSSIVAPQYWPARWLVQASTTVTGIGGMTLASRSPTLQVTIDGKTIAAVFSIVQLPPTVQCLVGRDILPQLGVIL